MQRDQYQEDMSSHFRVHPICAILGPRQAGKTTIAKIFIALRDLKLDHLYVIFPGDHSFSLGEKITARGLAFPIS